MFLDRIVTLFQWNGEGYQFTWVFDSDKVGAESYWKGDEDEHLTRFQVWFKVVTQIQINATFPPNCKLMLRVLLWYFVEFLFLLHFPCLSHRSNRIGFGIKLFFGLTVYDSDIRFCFDGIHLTPFACNTIQFHWVTQSFGSMNVERWTRVICIRWYRILNFFLFHWTLTQVRPVNIGHIEHKNCSLKCRISICTLNEQFANPKFRTICNSIICILVSSGK